MKLYKPLRLGYLSRIVLHAGRPHLAVALLSYFPFGAPRRIGLEQEMWQEVMPFLGGQPLDMCDPKPRAEVLLYGAFCAPRGEMVTQGTARLRLGNAIDKRISVVGRREWVRSPLGRIHATRPSAFARVPLDWAHAFGGPGFDGNPEGIGYWGRNDGQARRYLPNLHYPDDPLELPEDRIRPAAMSPRPITLPARQKRAGSYDAYWAKHHQPGYARDIHPDFFLTAPADQVLPGYFAGRESFLVEGMHPLRRELTGRLPGLNARCFVEQKTGGLHDKAPPVFREVPMAADTLLLFPEIERAILIHHGLVPMTEIDSLDITYLLAGFEWQEDRPRPLEHWRKALERRRDPATGAEALLQTDDICPIAWSEPTLEAARTIKPLTPRQDGGLPPRFAKVFQQMRAQTAAAAAAAGFAPAIPPADAAEPPEVKLILTEVEKAKAMPMNSLQDCEAINAQMQKIADMVENLARGETLEVERAARNMAERFGYDYDALLEAAKGEAVSDPDDVSAKIIQLFNESEKALPPESWAQVKGMVPADFQGDMAADMKAAAEETAAMKRETAHLFPPPAMLAASQQLVKAKQLAGALAAGGRPASAAMAGMDLSMCKLDGLDLSGVDLTGARLVGASLIGTNLEKAGLAHADLTRANFTGANLIEANLAKAVMDSTNFSKAKLNKLTLGDVSAQRMTFDEADLSGATFTAVTLDHASFARSNLAGTMFDRCVLTAASFRQAQVASTTFVFCRMPAARFDQVQGAELLMVNCEAPGARFTGSDIKQFALGGETDLNLANLSSCSLPGCNLGKASLRGAKLCDSLMPGSNLWMCDLTGADLSGSNLKGGILMRADMTEACLEGVDAMQANFLKAVFVKTRLTGINLYSANLLHAVFRDTEFGRANLSKTQLDTSNHP